MTDASERQESTPDLAQDNPAPLAIGGRGESRITSLDFIRGIAVMGILLANIVVFGQPMTAYMWPDGFLGPDGDPLGILWAAQFVLIDGKMRGLFTLLFGAGLYLFMERAWAKGASRWLQARRLAWLMAFGAVHYYLVWRGDILMSYAFAGFFGLLFLKWGRKTQLVAGLIGFVLGALVLLAFVGPLYFVAETPFGTTGEFADMRNQLIADRDADIALGLEEAALIQSGDYGAWVTLNFAEHGATPLFYFFLALMETVPLMLIGMALYRYGLFDGGIERRKLIRWGWAGVAAGVALTTPLALFALSTGLTYYSTLSSVVGFAPLARLPMILGLIALLAAYVPRNPGALATRVSAAGRMAFSNYLGTSIVMLIVFHGWGVGLFGELNRPQLYFVVLGVWALMLAWSKPWLARFRFGPLEWLWRCLTYGRAFAIRRDPGQVTPSSGK